MKINWRKLLGFVSKGAEIAGPILEAKKPGLGNVVKIGGQVAEKAAEKPEEPKK